MRKMGAEKNVYIIKAEKTREGEVLLRIGFGQPASNDEIVKEAAKKLNEIIQKQALWGSLVKVNGPASLPVAFTIAHAVAHRFGAIAVFDPKLGRYVVAISHHPKYEVGSLIE